MPHSSQTHMSTPLACTRSCLSKASLVQNLDAHIRHVYISALMCTSWCSTKSDSSANFWSQTRQVYAFTQWVSSCRRRVIL
ncbi:hypothetical protein MTO96_021951 [Rhipicephalus appendiculatus]